MPQYRVKLFEQLNEICYYGNNISWAEAYTMPVRYRNISYMMLTEFKKREAAKIKAQSERKNKFPTGKIAGIHH